MAEAIDAANGIEIDLANLLQWVKERYPGIISRPPVQAIAQTLANTQELIGPDMETFNNAAQEYNAYAQRFPNNVVAMILGYPTSYPFFQPRK